MADYNPGIAPARSGGSQPAPGPNSRAAARDSDGVSELLQLLARAVQQFHTYPVTSPMCQAAVDACHRAVLSPARADRLTFRVAPRDLIVQEVPVGRGTLVEHELARRLHAARIAQVTIDRGVSGRELSRFCIDLVRWSDRRPRGDGLAELLAEHGVDRITLQPAHQPEVLQVGITTPPTAAMVQQERAHWEATLRDNPVLGHLYPAAKGWVRLDPSSELTNVSLTELAVLSEDPAELAMMLLRLTDDQALAGSGKSALLERYSEVAAIFEALEPRVARVMFSKLARAVLDLEPDQRQALLRRAILPGLLDGRIDGAVLRHFPDVDLADSLCLLLDLEAAAPEVVLTALGRLDLSAERYAAVTPLLEERLNGGASGPRESSIEVHARKLVTIDRERTRSFAEFAAFDLAVDPRTTDALAEIRTTIAASDGAPDQLDCLWNLTRLEPNPEIVQRFVARATTLLEDLEGSHRWHELAAWLLRYRQLSDALGDSRPDVANVVVSMLARLSTAARAHVILSLAARPEGRALAGSFIEALGPAIAPLLLAAIHARSVGTGDDTARAGVKLLCDYASVLAPALVDLVATEQPAGTRTIARVLGMAGRGYESALAGMLAGTDEYTVREALRGLARIGTRRAAAAVAEQVEKGRGWIAAAAEETLWHFPRDEAERQVRALLARRDFVVRCPRIAARLLDRTTQEGASGMTAVLAGLTPLRYRIWNPALARLGRQAQGLVTR